MTKRGTFRVHGNGKTVGTTVDNDLLQHVDGTEDRMGRLPLGAGERSDGVVGAKDVVGKVDKVENAVSAGVRKGGAARSGPSSCGHGMRGSFCNASKRVSERWCNSVS